ncbi:alpha/beta hydrolase family protein [Paenibacillus hexagrammi]|uniref:alpha/beta hydrolase family protein n=1 Tax=Paenibacillus hexagrammi TaxID=2908839 RepID=UPI0028830AE5|nr:alpha/beta fold hydrolase [Paenibacillus sp. YPD9-1]
MEMSKDRMIRADFYPASSAESLGTLIVCHGYKGFKDWGMFPHAAEALASDVDVVAINFSHNGVGDDLLEFTELEKFAKATYSKDLEDLNAIQRLVASDEFQTNIMQAEQLPVHFHINDSFKPANRSKPFIFLGHSRGGAVCLIHALDHPEASIAGVISWNGIVDVDLLSEENKAEMREKGAATR